MILINNIFLLQIVFIIEAKKKCAVKQGLESHRYFIFYAILEKGVWFIEQQISIKNNHEEKKIECWR